MASFHLNQVRACSKAQASLNKILHTISFVKPPRRFDIDLNLSLVDACWEFDGENGNFDACSFVGKQIESDSSGNNGEKTKEGSCSEITNSHDVVEETKEEEGHETKLFGEPNGNDSFGLLIAAAELISSTEADSSSPSQDQGKETTRGEKATELLLSAVESTRIRDLNSCTADLEDTSAIPSTSAPVVRSKRGRSRVLPNRYRDSVLLLEPCKRRREPKMKPRARKPELVHGSPVR